jgi:hypothetical protein
MRVIADNKRGVIRSTRDQYLRVRLDGDDKLTTWHPTWQMIYLPDSL